MTPHGAKWHRALSETSCFGAQRALPHRRCPALFRSHSSQPGLGCCAAAARTPARWRRLARSRSRRSACFAYALHSAQATRPLATRRTAAQRRCEIRVSRSSSRPRCCRSCAIARARASTQLRVPGDSARTTATYARPAPWARRLVLRSRGSAGRSAAGFERSEPPFERGFAQVACHRARLRGDAVDASRRSGRCREA